MKYSELISFQPIENVVQLVTAQDKDKAREYVKTYVMSDSMAESLKASVVDQLSLEETINNKGVLIVGNYGTGKSHLMSMLSAVANDETYLPDLQNQNFAKAARPIAGKFEVLRLELGGVKMPLYDVILDYVESDFEKRGISFQKTPYDKVRNLKEVIQNMMMAFSEKYPDKGYLIVVDEFLSFLQSRNTQELILDLEFFRAMGEMCSRSRLRIIFGMQEKIFDNPKFGFVADTLKHVSDRFTQMIITKEATSYVVSERILKKTPQQKAWIREHLEKFCGLYAGMSSRLEEFVDLFPIHPVYIDIFNKLYLIENRHILKNISLTIQNIFETEVPEDAPGIISFDTYWPAIKSNRLLRSDPIIGRVVEVSGQLEDILSRAFPKKAYKPMAMQIMYALSVHRLTTSDLDVQFGMTAENLKDDLCIYMKMPEQDADFLLSTVKVVLKEIMATVSGQFIIYNEANNQYFIDVDKTVDYDEKIKQKVSLLTDDERNRAFYKIVYSCLNWDAKQYVTNFEIYQYDLNWDSHQIFREGYLFMGIPGDRSTAQPERDFYIHIMPPCGESGDDVKDLPDEVYFYFKPTEEFVELLNLYTSADSLVSMSEGKDKEAYRNKADAIRRKLITYLNDNKNTCFDVRYKKDRTRLIEILKGRYRQDMTFRDTVDLAASICLDGYFSDKYSDFPVMQTKITRGNAENVVRAAFDRFAGRKNQLADKVLQSFGVLDGDRISAKNSKYCAFYIEKLSKLPPQGVINYSDIFEENRGDVVEKQFKINLHLALMIFFSLIYDGYAVMTLKNGKILNAANLEDVPKIKTDDLCDFKFLARPSGLPLAELKEMFRVLEINPALLDNPDTRAKGVEELLKKAGDLTKDAVEAEAKLRGGLTFWDEVLVPEARLQEVKTACRDIKEEFGNYGARFNTTAKLNNFTLSMEQIAALAEDIVLVQKIREYFIFQMECAKIVHYMEQIDPAEVGEAFTENMERAKDAFRDICQSIWDGESGKMAARKVEDLLEKYKETYIDLYLDSHRRKRLDSVGEKKLADMLKGKQLADLKKLCEISILPKAQLSVIEAELSDFKICYGLTREELKSTPICQHCHYRFGSREKTVRGRLENIESRLESLTEEWTEKLLNAVSDPSAASQKKYLSGTQQKMVDDFIREKALPERVNDHFVRTIQTLLQGIDPVIVDADDLVEKLMNLPPMKEKEFCDKVRDLIAGYTKGKDAGKLRIIVKK